MYTTKTAVAHADDVVAAARGGADLGHQLIDAVRHPGARAQRGQRLGGVPFQSAGMTKSQLGRRQTPGQLRLHGAEFHAVAARLEHRQNAPRHRLGLLQAASQAVQCAADRARVVGKIVVHAHRLFVAQHHAAQLHAAAHALETGQRAHAVGRRHAQVLRSGQRGQRIELVVAAAQTPLQPRQRLAVLQHHKVVRLALGAKIAHRRAKGAQLAPQPLMQHALEAFFQPVGHHPARSGHGAQQVVELAFDRTQVFKNVGVVELQIVQHQGARPVVDEFAALVEKSGVVFVGLDDERRAGAQAGRNTKVDRHAADQKTRLQASRLQNPGQHGGGGGFAVGAGHRQHVTTL